MSPLKKKKLEKIRLELDKLDNSLIKIIKKRTNLVKKVLKLKDRKNQDYTNLEKIKKEVEDAKKTFKKYRWPTIDVTRKSVEETAASIIKIYEIFSNKKHG